MKTNIICMLVVLFTAGVQAQIPTLAERNFSAVKSIKDNDSPKKLSSFITKEIDEVATRNKQVESVMLQKKERLNSMGLDVDTAEKNNLLEQVKKDSITIDENKKIVEELRKFQKDIEVNISATKSDYIAIYQNLYYSKIAKIKAEIIVKKTEVAALDDIQKVDEKIAEIESLNKQIEDLVCELRTKNENHYWFPSTQKKYSNAFFKNIYNIKDNETSFLNSFALNYNDLGAVVQSEILGDTFRSFRISFGTVLQSNAETAETEEQKEIQTQEDQLDELLNGGGNFYLETQYPVYYNAGNFCSVYGFLNNRTALSLKGLNETIDSETFNTAFGVNFYLGLNSDEKKFNFFFKGDANVVIGSKSLYQNLQLAEEKPFLQGKLIVGVTFLSKFRLAATLNSFGSDDAVRRSKITVGLQIIP